jgi:hypothetical protein
MASDVHQLNIVASIYDEYCENVLFFENDVDSSPTPEDDAEDLINAFISNIAVAWLACLSSDYALGGYKAKRVNSTGGPTYVSPVSVATPGTIGSTVSCTSVGPLVTGNYYDALATAPRWRTTRIFLPGAPGALLVENEWQGVIPAHVASLIGLLVEPFMGVINTWTYVGWSRTHSVAYPIVGMELSFLVGTQRRRLHPVL